MELNSRLNFFYNKMGGLGRLVEILRSDAPKIIDSVVDRLRRLIFENKLRPLPSIWDGPKWNIHVETYVRTYKSLSDLRPFSNINNMVDSLNVALTYWLNTELYRHRKYFVFVTHSPFLILAQNGITWGELEEDPKPVVRTPLFLTTRILCKERLPPKNIVVHAERGTEILSKLQTEILLVTPESQTSLQKSLELQYYFNVYMRDYFERIIKEVVLIDRDSRRHNSKS